MEPYNYSIREKGHKFIMSNVRFILYGANFYKLTTTLYSVAK